jgi:hypothetical protein
LKIIQKMARPPFADAFNTGDVAMVPEMLLIAPIQLTEKGKSMERGAPFHFVPLFFFPEWCCWNPIQTAGQLDAIRERSLNQDSVIARKARNRDLKPEICPEWPSENLRYQEHLNFVITIIGNNPARDCNVIVSFTRGEHRTGSTLLSILRLRKAPMFGQQFEAVSTFRPGTGKGDWYGLDITAPTVLSGIGSWVTDPATFAEYEAAHNVYKKAHAESTLVVDYGDSDLEAEANAVDIADNPDNM